MPARRSHSHSKQIIRKRLTILLVGALILGVLLYSFLSFLFRKQRSTPFQATLDTTFITFTSNASSSDSQDAGLLAGTGTVDLLVEGCAQLNVIPAASSQDSIPCENDSLKLRGVQLQSLRYGGGTRIGLAIDGGDVSLQLNPPTGGQQAEVVISADSHSLIGDRETKIPGPREWSVKASNMGLTLVLTEPRDKAALSGKEADLPLQSGSSVFFEKHGLSMLTGEGNRLELPDLPKEAEKIDLGQEKFQIDSLKTGHIRTLEFNRNAETKQIESIHTTITGTSDQLMLFDVYSDRMTNAALTPFETWLEGDRKLTAVGMLALAVGLLTVIGNTGILVQAWFAYLDHRMKVLEHEMKMKSERPDKEHL